MLKKSNIQWTAKQIAKMMDKGTLGFDNSVQRGLCWKTDKKILLIDSMFQNYPIPAFYAARNEDKTYDMLDGKQRCHAIKEFIEGKFKLDGIEEVELEDGESIDVNGMSFEELPEELQDRVKDYSLTVYFFLDLSDDQVSEMFYRLNNGKALSAIELTRVKAKSFDAIRELGNHEIFKNALTLKQVNKYTNEDIVIKTYAMLYTENPSFETKKIRPLMQDVEFTEQQKEEIKKAYSKILDIWKAINTEDKEHKKIAKRILTRTHLLTIIPIVIKSDKTIEELASWLLKFYSGKRRASISEKYNSAAGSGSARSESIKIRLEELKKDYNEYFSNQDEEINKKIEEIFKEGDSIE